MKDKYYTPSLKEFHEGFRYYVKDFYNSSSLMGPFVFDSGIVLETFEDFVDRGQTKVKYLDQADIEELGWKYMATESGSKEFAKYYQLLDWWMIKSSRSLDVAIFNSTADNPVDLFKDREHRIFYGRIKNYNELRRLMIQLNILVNDQ
jgi:hypothetical protein